MSELAQVPDPDDVTPTEPLEGEVDGGHLLVLRGEVFSCGSDVPFGLLTRYAANPLLQVNKVLERVVPKDEQERMWDLFQEMEQDEAMEAVGNLVATYSERPTEPPARSSRGSTNTGPK